MIGKIVSHYQILEEIGSGGMGIVYRAADVRLGRSVAVKFLPESLVADPLAARRFTREARAASSLNHPAICQIYDVGGHDGRAFIVMEYLEGRTLKDRIREGPLPEKEVVNLGQQLASGLQVAHARGIIHRDIKSANIFLTTEGFAKILDFGLATARGENEETVLLKEAGITSPGSLLGTVAYMSPEQARGESLDPRSDLFSLGIVLFEAATGKLPFEGNSAAAVLAAILHTEPARPSRLRPRICAALEAAILSLLEKDRTRRCPSAGDLLERLHHLETSSGCLPVTIATGRSPSIAVLPFVNMSSDAESEHFGDGLAEDLINALTNLQGLRVSSRTSSFRFKGTATGIRDIGRELNVDYIVEGSVRRAGRRLRVTAQLINVSDGYHLWSERFDREMEDIFAIQDEISMAIVGGLKVRLLEDEKQQLTRHHTENQQAYDLYLRGRYFWNRRYEAGFRKALENFQAAIQEDPLYALPHVGMADTYMLLGHFGLLSPLQAFPKARIAAARALELDPSLSEAYASLGWVYAEHDWNFVAAEEAYRRAVELNPKNASACEWFALFLLAMGRSEEAIQWARRSLELDPLSLMINAMAATVLSLSGRPDEADDLYAKTLEMDPNFAVARIYLGAILGLRGRYQEALGHLTEAARNGGLPVHSLGFLGWTYGRSGERARAHEILKRLDELSADRFVSPFYKALIHAGTGELDSAFYCLEKALEIREPMLIWSRVAGWFDRLAEDPRLDEFFAGMSAETNGWFSPSSLP